MEPEHDATPDEQKALEMVSSFVHHTARRLQVCPCCIVFNLAEMISDAIESGRLEHGVPEQTTHWGVETMQ